MWKDSETEIDYLDFSYIVEIMNETISIPQQSWGD